MDFPVITVKYRLLYYLQNIAKNGGVAASRCLTHWVDKCSCGVVAIKAAVALACILLAAVI